jgi:hypothetical protein
MSERNTQRRAMVEEELRNLDVAALSNNEIHRRLRVEIGLVRATRRRLEYRGDIPVVLRRVSKRGRLVDVTRVLHSRGSARRVGSVKGE